MDLAKVDNKKHIYMVGMNDGAMPQPVSSSSLITLEEETGCGIAPSFIPTI
jgi:ATP-dependent helicase/nuclease subunit B